MLSSDIICCERQDELQYPTSQEQTEAAEDDSYSTHYRPRDIHAHSSSSTARLGDRYDIQDQPNDGERDIKPVERPNTRDEGDDKYDYGEYADYKSCRPHDLLLGPPHLV